MLTDMVGSNGTWKLDEFRKLLPEEIVQIIRPPNSQGEPNRIRGLNGSHGSFSVKNGYNKLTEASWNERDTSWKAIWSYQGPHRVRFFLWLAYKQKLLTNLERVRRTIGQTSVCPICQFHTEDVLHVLRDDPAANEVWLQLILNT